MVSHNYDSDASTISQMSKTSKTSAKSESSNRDDLIHLRRKFLAKMLKEKQVLFGQKDRLAKLNERLANLELSNKEASLKKKQLEVQVKKAEKGESDEAKAHRTPL